jgi:ABC-type antimicrobial peptide transport system permease subunit
MKKRNLKKPSRPIRHLRLILLLFLKIIFVIISVLSGFLIGILIFSESVILVTLFALLFATVLYLYLFRRISKAILD